MRYMFSNCVDYGRAHNPRLILISVQNGFDKQANPIAAPR